MRRLVSYLLYIGLGISTTLLILSVLAALMNIPNYGAKLVGQNCNCKVPIELALYVDFGGLMIAVGLFAPTLIFIFATICLVASRRLTLGKEFKRFFTLGVSLAILIAATLLLMNYPFQEKSEAVFESTKHYPLKIKLLNGSILNTDAFAGKVVVVQFFLPKCPVCELQSQELKKIVGQKSVDAMFMLVVPSWGRVSLEELEEYAQSVPCEILIGFDVSTATKEYGIEVVPAVIILSSDKLTAYMRIGLTTDKELLNILLELSKAT